MNIIAKVIENQPKRLLVRMTGKCHKSRPSSIVCQKIFGMLLFGFPSKRIFLHIG